jgi:hypothetical protein
LYQLARVEAYTGGDVTDLFPARDDRGSLAGFAVRRPPDGHPWDPGRPDASRGDGLIARLIHFPARSRIQGFPHRLVIRMKARIRKARKGDI